MLSKMSSDDDNDITYSIIANLSRKSEDDEINETWKRGKQKPEVCKVNKIKKACIRWQ